MGIFKKMSSKVWILIPCFAVIILAGCSQNIFEGLSQETDSTDTTELVESGQYDEAISEAETVINSSSSSSEDKQQAYVDKGLAILAKNGIKLGEIGSIAANFSDADDLLNGGLAELSDTMPIELDAAVESADCLNAAFALSESGTTTSSIGLSALTMPLAPSLNSTAQFRRAVANATVVIKMSTLYLDITENGATLNAIAKESNLDVIDVFVYLCGSSRNVFYYASNAYDAAVKSGAFSTNQLTTLTKGLEAAGNLRSLYRAYFTGTTFRLEDSSGNSLSVYTTPRSFSGSQLDSDKELVKTALNEIYTYYK